MTNTTYRSSEELIISVIDRHIPKTLIMDEYQQGKYEHMASELCQSGKLSPESTQKVLEHLRKNVRRI
jgi:hypothetical protein